MALLDFLRPRCPSCGERGLRNVQHIRATILIEGKRAPASWSYEECPRCSARFRQESDGPRLPATDEDWRRDVAPGFRGAGGRVPGATESD